MADKYYEIAIDTKDAERQLNDLTQSLENTSKKLIELKNADKENTKEFKDAAKVYDFTAGEIAKLNKQIDDNKTKTANLNKEVSGANKSLTVAKDAYAKAGGGIKGMVAAGKAFIATPLGVTIAAITAGIKLFSDALKTSEKGTRLVTTVTKTLSGVFAVLQQQLSNVGSLIASFFTGDWDGVKEAAGKIKDTFLDTGNIIKGNVELGQKELDLKKKEGDVTLQISKNNAEIARLRRIAKDDSKTEAERAAAKKKMDDLTVANYDAQINLKKEQLQLMKDQHALTDSNIDDINDEKALEAEINDLLAEKETALTKSDKIGKSIAKSAEKERDYVKEANDLMKELADEQLTSDQLALQKAEEVYKERAKQIDELAKMGVISEAKATEMKEQARATADKVKQEQAIAAENEKNQLIAQLDSEFSLERFSTELERENSLYVEKTNRLKQYYEDGKISKAEYDAYIENAELLHQDNLNKINDAGAKSREEVNKKATEAGMNLLSQASSFMSSQSEAGFEIGKAASIAETGINTVKSAQASFSAMAEIPVVGPALGAVAAAAATAMGLANIAKIKNTKFSAKSKSSTTQTPKIASPTSTSSTTTSQIKGVQGDLATVGMNTGQASSEKTSITPVVVVDEVTAKQQQSDLISKTTVM